MYRSESKGEIMKFKRNFLLTYILFFNSLMMFIMTPILMIMLSFVDDVKNMLFMVPVMFVLLTVLTIFLNIINMITWPFSKKIVHIGNNEISYNNKTIIISDITKIYFDLGTVNKFNGGTPCCLSLYIKDKVELSITHVSFIALLVIIKKCKKVPKRLMPKALYKASIILYLLSIIALILAIIF